jgi:hypothetical protein
MLMLNLTLGGSPLRGLLGIMCLVEMAFAEHIERTTMPSSTMWGPGACGCRAVLISACAISYAVGEHSVPNYRNCRIRLRHD